MCGGLVVLVVCGILTKVAADAGGIIWPLLIGICFGLFMTVLGAAALIMGKKEGAED